MKHEQCILVLTSALLAAVALGGQGPTYRYGDCWWQEYLAEERVALLLHFGQTAIGGNEALRQSAQEETSFEQVLEATQPGRPDLDAAATLDAGTSRAAPALPANVLADSSRAARHLPLPPGFRLTPEGRFGPGLACDGTGVLRTAVPAVKAVECTFRVDAYPSSTSCLFSVANGEAQLLLRPDGRLEFKLRKPHGNPDPKRVPPALMKVLLAKDASIVSPRPVPLKTWTHAAIWDKAHPAPGNTSPFDARLTVDGEDTYYISEGGNNYAFLGNGGKLLDLLIANSADGQQGFRGEIDEVRALTSEPDFYSRPRLTWREAVPARALQFDRPFFRGDGTAFHASLDSGLRYDRGPADPIAIDLHGHTPDNLKVPGIRGQGWLVEPAIGFPRFPLAGLSPRAGSLEFWVRAQNWDDCTGYWQHSPPNRMQLSILRVLGRGKDGALAPVLNVTLPRAYNIERARVPVDPGHWLHAVLTWDAARNPYAALSIDGKWHGMVSRAAPANLNALSLAFAEFGVSDDLTVVRGQRPGIDIDEVVGYTYALDGDEIAQARRRWMGALEPIKLYRAGTEFKYALQRLEFSLEPLLPRESPAAAAVSVSLIASNPAAAAFAPVRQVVTNGHARVRLHDGSPLAQGHYQIAFRIEDATGKPLLTDTNRWEYREEAWRHSRAGVLDTPVAPWTPLQVADRRITTAVTAWHVGPDGLPRAIIAGGTNLLADAIRIEERGQPLKSGSVAWSAATPTEVGWKTTFTGTRCDVAMDCRVEYDGMLRYELRLKPKGRLEPLTFVIPLRAEHANRYLYYPMGARGVTTGVVATNDGTVLDSRLAVAAPAAWRDFTRARTQDPKLTWEAFWVPRQATARTYGFFGHVDLHDRDRGLFWFCDNAAGWVQSDATGAIAIERRADRVELRLNLVATAADYTETAPIVFALLPHPARPMDPKYRLFECVPAAQDPAACSIFDAFSPWPIDPRDHSMKLFPAADPRAPELGPSWKYAESCIPAMQAARPVGYRTMYLSRAWFSCRTGAYDNWEWRSGDSSAVSLTPYFNNYLCWEMDEWLRRNIFDAVYLDECYEAPASNLEAGFSVRLPDGSEQPGVRNFDFRDLMRRWRGIFQAHGMTPMLMAHHTYSWQYPGLLYCDAVLDGENAPIVSLNSRDWIDSTSLHRYETLQNARLWGVSTFYMPFVSEGGFDDKNASRFLKWQWRMARQAQSEFAHFETATVYEGQGSFVYKGYWKDLLGWGAGDPSACTFHPYWNNSRYVTLAAGDSDAQVSLYRQSGKVLVIASNRAREPRTLRIDLHRQALSLPEQFRARNLDATFRPPPGDDYQGSQASQADAEKAGQASMDAMLSGLPDDVAKADLSLDDPDEVAARADEALEPRLEGTTLILPVRARDYRVVALE